MSENLHVRAQKLIAESLVEGLSPTDQSWLDQHLRECPECSNEASTARALLRAIRTVPVAVPRDLADRTQMRVRLRAQQISQSSSSGMLLWIITGFSWLLGVFSAPLVWRGFAWIGGQLNLPRPVLEFAFVLWWAVPALAAVAVVLHQRGFSSAAASKQP